jgi:hypothetical protein
MQGKKIEVETWDEIGLIEFHVIGKINLYYTLYILKIKIDLHIYGEIKIGWSIKNF